MIARIKDVAEKAGVSVATVSRALGGGPVSETLRQRVEDAVAATGYRPNLSARRLRTRHTQTVGLIVSDIQNPFFTAVARAVEDVAYEAGMRVILCNTDENPQRENMYMQLMQEERVTGVVFAPTLQMSPIDCDFPVVLIDRSDPVGKHDSVVLDNRQACTQLVMHCHAQGFSRIAGLFGATSTTGRERHEGYQAAMAALGLAPDARFVPPTVEAAERAVAEWMAGDHRPDAIVTSNGRLLMGATKAAARLGLSIPGDLGIVGFDNEEWTELASPGLTVIEQPVREIGQIAMNLLFERLKTPDLTPRKVVLSGRCIIRKSSLRNGPPPLLAPSP